MMFVNTIRIYTIDDLGNNAWDINIKDREMIRIIMAMLMAICVSTTAMTAMAAPQKPSFTICTGDPSGRYHSAGLDIVSALTRQGWNAQALPTQGSRDNLGKLLATHECDAAIVQEDVPEEADIAQLTMITVLYDEQALLLCNADVSSIRKLGPEYTIKVGALTSGTATTFSRITKAVFTDEKDRPKLVLGSLLEDQGMLATMAPHTCYGAVTAPDVAWVRRIDSALKSPWHWVSTDDKSLRSMTGVNRGTLYETSQPVKMSLNSGMFSSGAVENTKVRAILVTSVDWSAKASPEDMRTLRALAMLK